MNKNRPYVRVWTDGSVRLANPSIIGGGVGVVLSNAKGTYTKILGRYVAATEKEPVTNNMTELLAVVTGVAMVKVNSVISILSDSMYVVNGLEKILKYDRLPFKTNKNIWGYLLRSVRYNDHEIVIKHVKGHAGHEQNEMAHILAKSSAVFSSNITVTSGDQEELWNQIKLYKRHGSPCVSNLTIQEYLRDLVSKTN